MKKFMKIFTCFLFITVLTAGVSAKSASRTIFEIDFDFVCKDESFQAGKYSVERLSPANPEILVFKPVGRKSKAVLLIQTTGDLKAENQLRLRFKQSGGSYVLVGVWLSGKKYALDSGLEDRRRDARQPAEFLSFVLLPDVFGAA